MKILHVIGSLEDGGAEAVLYNLIKKSPHIDHVVAPLMGRGKYVSLLENEGVKVRPLGLTKNPFSVGGARKRLRWLYEEFDPMAVQAWMYHSAVLCCAAINKSENPKIFLGMHSTAVTKAHNSIPTYACIKLIRRMQAKYSRILYCSESSRRRHEAIGYPCNKGAVITNGICSETFRPNLAARKSLRNTFGVDQSIHLFGMVARVHPQKNHIAIIRAAKIIRQRGQNTFKIILAGSGTNDDTQLQKAIVQNNLSDVILTLGPRNDIPEIMCAIDTLVLPSAFGEAFPMVLCEAMSCGTPCIATDVGDASTILGEFGSIVPPGDEVALAVAMLKVIESKVSADKSDESIRERALESFSVEAMALAYEKEWASQSVSKMPQTETISEILTVSQ